MIDQSVGGGTPSIRDESVVAKQAAGRGARAVGRAAAPLEQGVPSTPFFVCLLLCFFLSFLLAFVCSSYAMPSGFGWFVDRHLERDAIVHAVRGNVQNSRLEPPL